MATYLQGVTDYIPQIQPFKPDYNFLGNILQARQSRYDSNYKQLSEQYGTLLNSPMMRDDNNKQRDEFFKIIDQDIKKISTMDLSLQKNVDGATRVFDSFYKNKYMVDDMVKTKKHIDQLSRADAFKNCHDQKKCGGMYWEEGVDYLKFKAEEYKNANREDTLSMDIGTFQPYYNWKPEAIKLAKDNDMSVTIDSSNGKYIVHDKNGKLVQGGLYQVFSEIYGDDPRVKANYEVESYVSRNRFINNNIEKYGSKEQAELVWIEDALKKGNEATLSNKQEVESANRQVSARLAKLNEKARTIGLTPEEQDIRNNLPDVKGKLDATNDALTTKLNEINSRNREIKLLRSQADGSFAQYLLNKDLADVAMSASLRGVEHTMKEDQYGVSAFQSQLRMRENEQQFEFDMRKIGATLNKELTIEQFKYGLENGMFDAESGLATGKGGNTGGTPLEGASYETASLSLADNPDAFYNMNREAVLQRVSEGKQTSADFLYQAFDVAKRAAQDPSRNPGAVAYLESHYGKNWNKINSMEALLQAGARKGTVTDLFNSTIKYLNQDENPNGDLEWANSLMSSNAKSIANIQILNQAGQGLLRKHADSNRKIAKDMVKLATDKESFYKDADLLVSESGVALVSEEMPSEFVGKFMKRYNNYSGGAYKVAEKEYKALRDKFLDIYNHSKEVSLQQGINLDGGGHLTGTAMRYSGIDAAKFSSGYLHKARLFADAAVEKPGEVSYVLGNPDKDALDDLTKEETAALASFMKQFQNDIRSKWGKTDADRPIFSMTEMPIAGNNADLAGAKFDINMSYLDKYIGTDKKKGILWNVKDKLADGITMVYNRKKVNTPTTSGLTSSAYEELIKTQGIVYDVPNAAKIELRYDPTTGRMMLKQAFKKHDPKTGRKYTDYKPEVPLPLDTKLDESYHQTILNQLEMLRIANEQFDAQVANYYRDK